jgi:transglutaminase-like putative cysteine protease
MQDAMRELAQQATVDRLSKIIAEPRSSGGGNNPQGQSRRPAIHIHISLEEGWFSLFLVAAVVYSTIWSVQSAGWVDHLGILTWVTALGLLGGVIASKQKRFPRWAVHLVAILLGIILAYWQTAAAFYAGSLIMFAHGIYAWFLSVIAGGTGEDDSIFLFFITALSFLLAYASAWFVYRTRSPWLMIIANAVVLLINLSNLDPGFVIFLVIFLMAALLLLLRFNLYESIKRWRKQGLRYADDLGWDVMQTGTLVSIGILIVSWFLPWGYTNPYAAQIWNLNANPIVQFEDTWNRILSMSGGTNIANHGNFRDTLVLGGNPNLNHVPVFQVDSTDPSQYLAALNYDTYDGRGWSNTGTQSIQLPQNNPTQNDTTYVHTVTQHVLVVNPPGEDLQYLFGAPEIQSVNQNTTEILGSDGDSLVALLDKNGRLTAGEQYTVMSYVSSASEDQLRSIPMPANSPHLSSNYPGQYPVQYFEPATLNANLQLPKGLDPRIAALARRITANAPTMYDKAVAIEKYLSNPSIFTYDTNINPPPGQDPVAWFLFESGNKGYCNYFASAMAIMLRTLGIPARISVGYTNGKYDTKVRKYVIDGSDAHAWTQVYFAGYGWINFEPSAGFPSFVRPYPGEYQGSSSSTISTGKGGSPVKAKTGHGATAEPNGLNGQGPTSLAGSKGPTVVQGVGYAFGSLVLIVIFLLILFSLWWRRLFRTYKLPRQIFGRICLIANWAGVSLQTSLTPYEYVEGLSVVAPQEAVTLQRLGDIYVRELWADPRSADHPERTGEINEMQGLWTHLQPRLFLYLMRHPSFLYAMPGRAWKTYRRWRTKRKLDPFEEDF